MDGIMYNTHELVTGSCKTGEQKTKSVGTAPLLLSPQFHYLRPLYRCTSNDFVYGPTSRANEVPSL